MTKFLVLLCLLPLSAFAAPVDTSAADLALVQGSYAVGLVGGVVLGVYALLAAFRNVRSALGFTGMDSADLAPPPWADDLDTPFPIGDGAPYLSALAQRLAAEDAALGIDFRDVETGKTNLDYMREAGLAGEAIDRSQHSSFELDAYDKGAESASMKAEREEIFLTPADMDDGDGMGDGTFQDNQPGFVGYVSQRAEAEAYGADMALYDKFMAEEDATHEEALRWSSMGGEIKMPALPTGFASPVDQWEAPPPFSSFAEASAAFNAPGAEAAAKNYAVTTYAASTLAGYEWSSDEDGVYRMGSINVNGVERSYRIDYAEELASAADDARFDFERNDGLTSAERSSLKEIAKSHDMEAMRDQ